MTFLKKANISAAQFGVWLLASISLAIANNIAASFGVIPLALLFVVFKVNSVVLAVCMGIGQGFRCLKIPLHLHST